MIENAGVIDCYQPLESRYRLTRACLEVLQEFRNPVSIITKNVLKTFDARIRVVSRAPGSSNPNFFRLKSS